MYIAIAGNIGSGKTTLPQFGIVQATNPSCLLYFP